MNRPTKEDVEASQDMVIQTLREDVRKLREELATQTDGRRTALAALERIGQQPSYSTESVDALLEGWEDHADPDTVDRLCVAVRASREPKRCKGCNFEGSCYWMWDSQRKCCPDCTCVAP